MNPRRERLWHGSLFDWWSGDQGRSSGYKFPRAFFRRGGHGKIPVTGTSLALPVINEAARKLLALLRSAEVAGRSLKTLLIRASQQGKVSAQIYVKEKVVAQQISRHALEALGLAGIELIYSDPHSPASVVSERLMSVGSGTLTDEILGIPFHYATEGFFQINLPVYEMVLRDMQIFVLADRPVIDLYSGVGSIGLTIGGKNPTLVEISGSAVAEMRRNLRALGRHANIVHASSESALEYINSNATIIVDPPRAGLHEKVIQELLIKAPERIIYLSCNPVTQARDVMMLSETYGIREHIGYNFFPRTPHIEHLVILDRK
ncbi:(Uracil-5)-methyltransferase [candidate division TM7 genomosp. GTL1]|nr:(Uracil-5)-methyltransferase [candidate division TM7 genomosp. GTL1]